MSGGHEQTEVKEIPPFIQKLLEKGVPKESVGEVVALMNVECLERMERWKRNLHKRRKRSERPKAP